MDTCFVRGAATSLAQTLIRVFQDEEGRRWVAERALEYVRLNHDWNETGKRPLNCTELCSDNDVYGRLLRRMFSGLHVNKRMPLGQCNA